MGKGSHGLGGRKNAGIHPGWGDQRRCVSCRRTIMWGERCEGCKRELLARRRRKPR